jgi:hypothetical protein
MEIQFFQFEAEHVKLLQSVPMIVRFKLDVCGIALTLRTWRRLNLSTRARLVTMPIDSLENVQAYRTLLSDAIRDVGDMVVMPENEDTQPAWVDREKIPEVVARTAQAEKVRLRNPRRWANLGPLQRFALVKLTHGTQEKGHFVPALREFGLAP